VRNEAACQEDVG